MPKRKAVEPALKNWGEADCALARLCRINFERARAEALLNAAINAAKERHLPTLNDLADEEAVLRAELQQFGEKRRAEFEPKKSVERLHGILSFRTSPPAVKPAGRAWTWQKILKALTECMPMYVRTREEVDKEAILADHASRCIDDEDLKSVGVAVVQDQTFGIELKQEATPN